MRSDTVVILSTFNPHVPCELAKKICLLQLLPSSALQKRPFAKEIQNLIAWRRSAQTYSQKSPNYPRKEPKIPSEFPEKNSIFLSPAAVDWWSQAASELLEKNTFGVVLVLVVACTNILTHRNFLHTNLFEHRFFFLYRDTFKTETLLNRNTKTYTKTFIHKNIHTQRFSHIESFTYRNFYTPTLFHKDFFFTDSFTHRGFYTGAGPFTHRPFHTHTLSHA